MVDELLGGAEYGWGVGGEGDWRHTETKSSEQRLQTSCWQITSAG